MLDFEKDCKSIAFIGCYGELLTELSSLIGVRKVIPELSFIKGDILIRIKRGKKCSIITEHLGYYTKEWDYNSFGRFLNMVEIERLRKKKTSYDFTDINDIYITTDNETIPEGIVIYFTASPRRLYEHLISIPKTSVIEKKRFSRLFSGLDHAVYFISVNDWAVENDDEVQRNIIKKLFTKKQDIPEYDEQLLVKLLSQTKLNELNLVLSSYRNKGERLIGLFKTEGIGLLRSSIEQMLPFTNQQAAKKMLSKVKLLYIGSNSMGHMCIESKNGSNTVKYAFDALMKKYVKVEETDDDSHEKMFKQIVPEAVYIIKQCPRCRLLFEKDKHECPICGSELMITK